MASIGPHTLKLPRLRVRERLIQECPGAAELLGIHERLVGSALPVGAAAKPLKAAQTVNMSAAGRSLLAGSLMEDETTPEELTRQELVAVKAERARLLEQLTLVKTDPGKAGGDLQQEDILILRQEVEIKKAKLSELHEELLVEEGELASLALESQDCELLMPDGCPEASARLSQLKAQQEAVAVESAEAGAKFRLYTHLEARTKRELQAMASKVTASQNLQSAFEEDEAAMLIYVHGMNAALQDALEEKQRVLQHLESTKEDWARKLQARHKEVHELQRRQQEDAAREERRMKGIADQEALEQEKKAQWLAQEKELASSLQATQQKVDILEEAWSRLHTITGADTAEKLIAYWHGLKVQQEDLLKLVSTAESRQREAKLEIEALLTKRSQILEEAGSDNAGGIHPSDHHSDGSKLINELKEAKRRSEVAKKHFYKYRDVCVSAQQGLVAMSSRIETTLGKADVALPSPAGRRTSSVSGGKAKPLARQSTLSRGDGILKISDVPAGPKLQRMYTIDQDAFFSDLPKLVSTTADRLQSLVSFAKSKSQNEGDFAKGVTAAGSPIQRGSKANEDSRRRTWTGPPWLVAYSSLQGAELNRKAGDGKVDLTRLVGYTEEPRTIHASRQSFKEDEKNSWDGVVTRQLLKNRAAKVVQKYKASIAVKA